MPASSGELPLWEQPTRLPRKRPPPHPLWRALPLCLGAAALGLVGGLVAGRSADPAPQRPAPPPARDREAPHLSLLEPGEQALRLRALRLRLRVEDASPVQLVVSLDGRPPLTRSLAASGELLEELGPLGAGGHVLTLDAMDAGGNATRLRRVFWGQDGDLPAWVAPGARGSPSIALGFGEGEVLAPGPLPLRVEGALAVELRLNGRLVARAPDFELDPSTLTPGEHLLEVRAYALEGLATELRGFTVAAPSDPNR